MDALNRRQGETPASDPDHLPDIAEDTPAEISPQGSIALVAAPFNSFRRPSIQIGLLAAIARQSEWSARTHHLFLDFAAMIGSELYERIANDRGVAVGDWLFSVEAFGAEAP